MNLPRRRAVVFFAVLLVVAVGLLVSTLQGRQAGVATGGVPASVVVLPGLAAAGVAAVAIVATNRRERERLHEEAHREVARQDHERELKRVELEDQRQMWLREERRQVYSEFQSRWTLYEAAKTQGPQKEEEARLEFMRSFNALSLLAPEEVRGPAADVFNRAVRKQQQNKAPGLFWKAARKDLDIPL